MKDYILQRGAPGANPGNALQIHTLDGICCGDSIKGMACKYSVSIPTGSLATLGSIRIAGVTHELDEAWAITTINGREGLKANIEAIIETLGYSSKNAIGITYAGSTMTVSIFFSNLEFNWLGTSAYPFLPSECKVIGSNKGSCCDARVNVIRSGDNLVVSAVACNAITTLTINDGGGNVYSGDLSAGTSGDATVAAGVVTVDGSGDGQDWTGAITFTITVVQAGCDNYVWTGIVTFP